MDNVAVDHKDTDERRMLMSWVNMISDDHRLFTVPADQSRTFGIREELLAELESDGLPFRMKDGIKHYDGFDLNNISLHMGLPSLQKMAMRCWKSSLVAADETDQLSFSLEYRIDPSQLAMEDGALRVLVPFKGRQVVAPGQLIWSGAFARSTQLPSFPPEIVELMQTTLAGVKFYMLREEVRWQSAFIEKNKLAECGGTSKLLCQKAHDQGIRARQVFGLILAQPYATPHYWIEFMVDDEWIAADPMMLRVLHMSSALNSQTWPEHRSPDAVLLALSEVIGYEEKMGRPILKGMENEPIRIDPTVTQGARDVLTSFPLAISTKTT